MKINGIEYVAPTAKAVEISVQGIICTSDMTSSQTEAYEVVETEGWF